MQPWSCVWVFTVLILVLLSSANEARRKKGKPKGDGYEVRANRMKRGFTLGCRCTGENSGPIVSLSVAGQKNNCIGLTASMIVQVNSCLWKKTCHLKADPHGGYMLRLFRGTPEDCILQSPKTYRIAYLCARPQVPVIDLRAAGGAAEEEEKAWRGILRSHEDHPWLYRHRQDRTLTFVRPNATATAFLYTILKLKLYSDVLRVTTGNRNMAVISHQDDVTNMTAEPIVGERRVKFELEMSRYSTGEEGFVLCFQWLTDRKRAEMKKKGDACRGLLGRGDRPVRTKGGRKRTKAKCGKGKNRRKKNNRGRRGKTTTTTTTTPRP